MLREDKERCSKRTRISRRDTIYAEVRSGRDVLQDKDKAEIKASCKIINIVITA